MKQASQFFSSVEEFVEFSGGDHAIKRILIANNGIGAVKAIRSIRRWCFETFGNERMIEFVVMATPEDLRANAEYIRMGDCVVDVPGGTNNNNYANVTLICDIAERFQVDAVMPLWGHASENPNLPNSLLKLKRKVTFIGPPAEPMLALGDKIGSTIIAQSAGVPTISWNGDSLKVDYKNEGIPQNVYDAANVLTPEEALECCDRIGYPVMIKASEGGGGKGIRKVTRSEDVFNSFKAVQGEIPGSPIFVMKMASQARHLEVQLLADKHGEAIALSGRDCSVQRRHQKIIEEGPPIAAPIDVFREMEKAAVSLAKTVGYINAGTVEYLYMEDTQEFAFLELNPRLQVEHPVTENILGVNLPACQLQVAMGLHLHSIGDIRKLYGRHPRGRDTIDFEYSERKAPPRHCIAVRVTAENPDAGFQPTSGKIQELHFRSSIDVWGYFSVDHSGLIHEFADSQFGHIFASGPDRESARKAMIVALKELEIRGEIRITIEYIIKMLQSKDFIENKIDTMWLDGRIARFQEIAKIENAIHEPPATLVATVGLALLGFKQFDSTNKEFIHMLRCGHVPNKSFLTQTAAVELIFNNVKFVADIILNGPDSVIVCCNKSSQTVSIRNLSDGGYLLNIDGKSHLIYSLSESGGSMRLILDGHTCMFTPEYDPTKLVSTVAGKLARVLVGDGSHVNAGDPFVEIEVMKMYMPLKVLESGTISFQMSEGATLSPGSVIATVVLDEPDKVVKAEVFKGELFADAPAVQLDAVVKPHLQFRNAKAKLEKVLEGYRIDEAELDSAFSIFISSFNNKLIPSLEVEEALSVLRGRIDADLYAKISELNTVYLQKILADENSKIVFPAAAILRAINDVAQSLPIDKRIPFNNQTLTIWSIVEQYLFSPEVRTIFSLLKMIEGYLSVERYFDSMSFTDVVGDLRKEFSKDLDNVLRLCRSHLNIASKGSLMLKLLEEIKFFSIPAITQQRLSLPAGIAVRNDLNVRNLKLRLTELAKLRQPIYSHVSFSANLLLMEQYTISTETRRQKMDDAIIAALTTGDLVGQGDRVVALRKFIESNVSILDILFDALKHDSEYQLAVLELYSRAVYHKTHRMYNYTSGQSISPDYSDNCTWIKFDFKTKIPDLPTSSPGQPSLTRALSFTDLTGFTSPVRLCGIGNAAYQMSEYMKHPLVTGTRTGLVAKISLLSDVPRLLPMIIQKFPVNSNSSPELINALHIVLLDNWANDVSDESAAEQLSSFVSPHADNLKAHGIRRVTFFVGRNANKSNQVKSSLYTFRDTLGYAEDRLYRNIEAPHAFHLELFRLSNFLMTLVEGSQSVSGNVHLYRTVPKNSTNGSVRYFARLVSFSADIHSSDLEALFVEALDNLGIVIGREEAYDKDFRSKAASNHVFVNVVNPDSVMKPDLLEAEIRRIWEKYWYKMVRLSVSTVEIKLSCRINNESEPVSLRFVAYNPTGFVLKVDQYIEALDGENTIFKSIGDRKGIWDGLSTQTPYEVSQKFEKKRAEAMASSDTLYVYDWPALFEHAATEVWKSFSHDSTAIKSFSQDDFDLDASPHHSIMECLELVLCDPVSNKPLSKPTTKQVEDAILLPMKRDAGLNEAGMVAWIVKLKTPEVPTGREFILIANDITHQAGSFGTKEDLIFFKASEYARSRGLPRLYLAANSGARIGMAESLKSQFKVSWMDENDPSKGFRYIYLEQDAFENLLKKVNGDVNSLPVVCRKELVNGSERYVITDIIGEEPDLGVENLMGSGLIAGATSRAYDEIFTLTLVVGRTVGIGAYLVRLGQRTIQRTRSSPIILTGYQALNKLMGREIYSTNDQLGGPMIMFPNGVSHLLADTHYDSVLKALNWLSFVPAKKGAPLPIKDISGSDVVERPVQFSPPKGASFDPRYLLEGIFSQGHDDLNWESGFFDRNSFVEYLGGWAKTVVVGRGRLGGIPMGVIVTENRTSEALKPADPADATSQERMVQQAGGVWFPDSAYKTAQALKDFNREGLPCIIFANWRGFSGGQRDMFDEVLKFGSMIVDALVAYQQPLFVYIPPFAELRGGAWVVVDSTINSDVMEFYAAENARGGVLEAAGAATIKFRQKDISATAHRVDYVLIDLDKKLAALKASGESDSQQIADIEAQIKKRERSLFGVFQQVAVHFADLHDTPGRMKAKGVIRKQVDWAASRSFFFWRLKRRLEEFEIANQVLSVGSKLSRKEIISQFNNWIASKFQLDSNQLDNDQLVFQTLEANRDDVSHFASTLKSQKLAHNLAETLSLLAESDSSTIESTLSQLPSDVRKKLLGVLQK